MSDAKQAALLRDLTNKNSMSTQMADSTQQAVTPGTAGGTFCVADS